MSTRSRTRLLGVVLGSVKARALVIINNLQFGEVF